MKKALVLGVGGLRGAYDAGVVATLCRELGSDYFDTVYASSAGVAAASYYLSNQPEAIEHVWRERVSGNQLINYTNPIQGKNIIDTDYLISTFQNGESALDLEGLFSRNTRLYFAIRNVETGECEYINVTEKNIFASMRAATAISYIHKPVLVNGSAYIDAGLIDPLPVQRAIDDGHDEIIAVYNKSIDFYGPENLRRKGMSLFSLIMPTKLKSQFINLAEKAQELNEFLDLAPGVTVIRPEAAIKTTLFNTDKKVINDLFDLGVRDGLEFLESHTANVKL